MLKRSIYKPLLILLAVLLLSAAGFLWLDFRLGRVLPSSLLPPACRAHGISNKSETRRYLPAQVIDGRLCYSDLVIRIVMVPSPICAGRRSHMP